MAGWIHRHYRFRGWRTQLAPTNGSMGYGVPAANRGQSGRTPTGSSVAAAGDGCFLMNGQELATAAQYGIAPIVLVIDNGMYGTIRMHQERDYPHRAHGTALANPDFAALARAYGCHGERVERTQAFADAFERALASGRPGPPPPADRPGRDHPPDDDQRDARDTVVGRTNGPTVLRDLGRRGRRYVGTAAALWSDL